MRGWWQTVSKPPVRRVTRRKMCGLRAVLFKPPVRRVTYPLAPRLRFMISKPPVRIPAMLFSCGF